MHVCHWHLITFNINTLSLELNCNIIPRFLFHSHDIKGVYWTDHLRGEFRIWGCVGGRALIWRKLPIIQLSTSFPLLHRNWINSKKAAKSEKVKSRKGGHLKRGKKDFFCVVFSCYSEQSPNKALQKGPLDLDKLRGASSVSLCYRPARLLFRALAKDEAMQRTLDHVPGCFSQQLGVCMYISWNMRQKRWGLFYTSNAVAIKKREIHKKGYLDATVNHFLHLYLLWNGTDINCFQWIPK